MSNNIWHDAEEGEQQEEGGGSRARMKSSKVAELSGRYDGY